MYFPKEKLLEPLPDKKTAEPGSLLHRIQSNSKKKNKKKKQRYLNKKKKTNPRKKKKTFTHLLLT